MNFNYWNLSKNDIIYLIIVFIFSLLCTIKMSLFSMSGGILNPDTALYLLSALKYAGLDQFNVVYSEDLYYTPVISFLTSLFFRIGYIDKNAIIIVTSIFCFLSYIGLYILLKNRFTPLLSLTGVIIYGSLSNTIFSLCKGLIDLPAVSVSIWILIFAIIAIDKDSKYFLLVFPLLVIGIFTKYVAGFALPLIFLYYLMKRNIVDNLDCLLKSPYVFKQKLIDYIKSSEFKYIIISLIISLILAIIICKFLILDYGGSLTFFKQSSSTFIKHGYSNRIDPISEKFFYLIKFKEILFRLRTEGILLTSIVFGILGFATIFNIVNINKNLEYFKSPKKSFKTKHLSKILFILAYVLIFIVCLSFIIYSNHMVSNISFLIIIILLLSILQKYNVNKDMLSFDLLFLAYFMINFIFLSLYLDKTYRYASIFIPPFIYFIIWGLDSLLNRDRVLYLKQDTDRKVDIINNNFKLSKIIPILLIIIFLISTLNFILPMKMERTNEVYEEVLFKGFIIDLMDVCEYINKTDSNYHSKNFTSYYHHSRTIRWYLQVNVTELEERDLLNLSEFNDTDYIILNDYRLLNNYHKIYKKGDFCVYYHN